MRAFVCSNCGSGDLREENGYMICEHCGSKFLITAEDLPETSQMDLNSDVAVLLQKCRTDPVNAKKYAKRILEIDPSNYEALRIMANSIHLNEQPKSGCYVATAVYGSYDCPEVWTLRRYRDRVLANSWYGRTFIRCYYALSPTLVRYFGNSKVFKNIWKPTLDRMVDNLNRKGFESTPYTD